MSKTRGEYAVWWIERYCAEPSGRHKGKAARLSPEQCTQLLRIYDGNGEYDEPVGGALGAYLALLHLCSAMAKRDPSAVPPVEIETDAWTIMRAAQRPVMRAVLERRGERVVCPQLGTSFPRAA